MGFAGKALMSGAPGPLPSVGPAALVPGKKRDERMEKGRRGMEGLRPPPGRSRERAQAMKAHAACQPEIIL